MEIFISKSDKDIHEMIHDMCKRLLANTVIEDYRYEIEECVQS